jgi:ADP-L-glycero-D-manno-heptose 6-epimerase
MIYVTGGLGFIGQNFSKYLDTLSIEHVIVDFEGVNVKRSLNKRFMPYTAFQIYLNEGDTVYHFGAISSTKETSVNRILQYNLDYTLNLIKICEHKKCSLRIASSASVYGNSKTFNENDFETPLNLYAWSKSTVDQLIKLKNLDVQSYRFFNVYSEDDVTESHKEGQASPHYTFRKQLKETGHVTLFEGSDKIYRDFISVNEVCQKVFAISQKDFSGVVNIGTGKPTSFLEVAQSITDKIDYIEFPDELKDKYQYYTKADITKLSEILKT